MPMAPSPTMIGTTSCSDGCPDEWVGDGMCDTSCNVEACKYDGTDCFHDASECWAEEDGKDYRGKVDECWLMAAAKANLPMVVPGHEDSTFGNIFASHVKLGECNASIVKSGIEYMAGLYDDYKNLSKGKGIGFFQIGGDTVGCVFPSRKL